MGYISEEAKALALRVAKAEASDILLYNGPINEEGLGGVIECFDRGSQHESVILILSSFGGSANSAFRLARVLQSVYRKFCVLVFSFCKSAGTIVATGAHRLIMAQLSELGPLDVQLRKRDELWERRSGLLLRSALTSLKGSAEAFFSEMMLAVKVKSRGSISFKLASELAADMTCGLFGQIYSRVTPAELGEDWQELHVAYEYARRLAEAGGLVSEEAIHKLVHDYPSHDFVIDRLEARKLFSAVDEATDEMYALAAKLGPLVYEVGSAKPIVESLAKIDKIEEKIDEKTQGAQSASEEQQQGSGRKSASPP